MAKLLREAGFSGTVADYERRLASDPAMHFSTKDEMLPTRATCWPASSRRCRDFSRVPRMTVGVRPDSAGSRGVGGIELHRGHGRWDPIGVVQHEHVPADRSDEVQIEALVLHETVPGHHLQFGLARELRGCPIPDMFRAAAFPRVGACMPNRSDRSSGVSRSRTRFGQLASEQFRAVRLVVDTGIHAMGWSRDRAREYFAQHVPSQSLAEVDRYIARPGQALAYKLGELEIRDCGGRPSRRSAPVSTSATSTTPCCATVRSRSTCWNHRSMRTLPR